MENTRSARTWRRRSVLSALAGGVAATSLGACGRPATSAPGAAASTPAAPLSPTASPTRSRPTATPTPTSTPTPTPSGTPTASSSSKPSVSPSAPSLRGDRRNSWAFAPLTDPSRLTVEGSVAADEAWSTSKVLVVAAFLEVVAADDPGRVSAANRRAIAAALSRSDATALVALQNQVPGVGRRITRLLRGIGDETTTAPEELLGLMPWSVREQVRFLLALNQGRVVSPAADRYLLDAMHPIPAHAWGLGTIGATAYKGGWLRQGRVTRQFGLVDGYAVAVITDAVGPVVRQSDGDSAHVQQLNRLAAKLQDRLAVERTRR